MRPDETRARILAATDELFGSLGFDATTTREIAARSGVNKALIHYHFGSKDELLEALLEDYYARLGATMAAALGVATEPEAQVLALCDAYADFLAANRSFCTIVQRELASGRHMERIVLGTLPMFALGRERLGDLAAGAPDELALEQLLVSVYGLVVTYFTHGEVLRRLTGEEPFTPAALEVRKRHVRRVARLLFAELEAERGTRRPAVRPSRRTSKRVAARRPETDR